MKGKGECRDWENCKPTLMDRLQCDLARSDAEVFASAGAARTVGRPVADYEVCLLHNICWS